MADCPSCGVVLQHRYACQSCDWRAPAQNSKEAPDPLRFSCQHVFQGQRCAEAGTLSEGIRGGGPWYCHKHYPPFYGRYSGKPSAPPGGFKALKDVLKRVDPEAILEREAIQSEGAANDPA